MVALKRQLAVGSVVLVTAGAAAATAVLAAADGAPPGGPAAPVKAVERAQTDDMSLREIARASTGQPGEVIPPCPEPAVASQLKEAGIPFGPCDPLPEQGETTILPEETEPEPQEDGAVCVSSSADRGPVDLSYDLGCAEGLRVLESRVVEHEGSTCMKVTYIPEAGDESKTEYFCDESPRASEPTHGPHSHGAHE